MNSYCKSTFVDPEYKLEYTTSLLFTKTEDEKEYREYSRCQLYGPIYSVFVILIFAVTLTRTNFPRGLYLGPWYFVSTILFIATFLLLLIFILGRHLDVLTGEKLPRRAQKIFDFVIDGIFRNEMESIISIISNVSFTTALIARVIIGECPDNVTYFKALSCNPLEKSFSPPIDSILLCFMSTLFLQLFFKNVRKSVSLFIWLMTAIIVCWSIIYLQAWTQSWLFTNIIVFAVLQYEWERMQMSAFLKSKHILEVETLKRILLEREHAEKEDILKQLSDIKLKEEKARIDMQLMELDAKNEVKLREAESAQLRSLVGNVAHDLKTPIHSQSMDIELLKNNYLDVMDRFPAVSEYFSTKSEDLNPMTIFESLESSCKFMTMSLNRCLDYTKAAGNIALKPMMESFNMLSTLKVPVRCIKHHLQKNDQERIIVHPLSDEVCPNIISDKHWFSENLLCLLSNAIKYSDKATIVDVRMELVSASEDVVFTSQSCKDNRQMIQVSVADKGIGIAESCRATIFQPFKQVQRMAGGTGLGLYSLQKRMESLNGSCGLKSRSDGLDGSVFWFAFPYRPDTTFDENLPELAISNTNQIPRSPVPSDRTSLRILLVDDSISILKVTSRALRAMGHQVETEENGSLGLARMKKALINNEFDLLLTDLQMPVMDGFLFVKRFRQYEEEMLLDEIYKNMHLLRKCNNNQGKLLIIGMSANSDDVSKRDALTSGMNSFISKPFVYQEFWNILRTYL